MGYTEWDPVTWAKFERNLEAAGFRVQHCAHCDRSNRHPSCRILVASTGRAAPAGEVAEIGRASSPS